MRYLDTAFEKLKIHNSLDIAYLLSIFVLSSLIFHIDTCLVDAFYILVFVSASLLFRVKICKTEKLSVFNFLNLVIAFMLMLNLDKVENYPESKYDLIKFIIHICIFLLLIFSIKFVRAKSTIIYALIAPVLVFTHIIEFPQDITRQILGNALVASTEPVYFTKIRFSKIYSVELKEPDRSRDSRGYYCPRKPIYFVLKNGEYKEMQDAFFVAGDGSMDAQYIDEKKFAFKLFSGQL